MVMVLSELSDELSQSSSRNSQENSFVTPSESNIPIDSPMNMSNLRRYNMSKTDMSDVFQTRSESSSSSENIKTSKRKLPSELDTNSSTHSISSSYENIPR